ncbi:MAG: (5-formylfuran-3-yl)methyl phosphate synthase [Planctomycetota bacterium]
MIDAAWRRGLLVSVREVGEAAAAIAGGAVIVDVKDPARGPLGRADAAVAAAVISAVAGRAPVTLACGELAAGVDGVLEHLAGVLDRLPPSAAVPTAIKAGPAGLSLAAWRDAFARLARHLPRGIEPVAVAYADCEAASAPRPEELLAEAARLGVTTILIDTCDKQGPGLFAAVGRGTIADWIALAAEQGVTLALAGRLTAADVAAAFALGADICGVRTAACDGGRLGRVAAPLVNRLVTLSLAAAARAAVEPSGDPRP